MVDDGIIPFIAVKVDRGGSTLYSYDYGHFSTPLVEHARFTANTIARFFSMTKPIVSAAVLLLWERLDHFDLDAPISRYIPEWDDDRITVVVRSHCQPGDEGSSEAPDQVNAATAAVATEPARRPITTRDLLTHSAGLSYGFWPDSISATAGRMAHLGLELPVPIDCDPRRGDKSGADYPTSLRDFCERLQDVPLVAQPGQEFHYSCSPDVLGRLVECLSGQSLDDFFREEFFGPLGMQDTAFVVGHDKLHRLAPCFRVDASVKANAPPEDGRIYMMSPANKVCRFKLATEYALGEVSKASPWHAETTGNFKVGRLIGWVSAGGGDVMRNGGELSLIHI